MAPRTEPSFLCTFCWVPQYPSSKPKVLGREARIACETCWRSVLDLSICWVCGEMVGRGEEVVSLGWCFWHRACFGCLICGTGMNPPVVEEGNLDLAEDDDDGSPARQEGIRRVSAMLERGQSQRQRGVELEYVPLCSWCENSTEGMDDKEILESGLVNVTSKDGGLARSRLGLLTSISESTDAQELRLRARAMTKEWRRSSTHEKDLEQTVGLLQDAANMATGGDGNAATSSSGYNSPSESFSSTSPPLVYMSVLKATGEPSFRRSTTKPLPTWMTLLPSNQQGQDVRPSPPEPVYLLHGEQVLFGTRDSAKSSPIQDSARIISSQSSFVATPSRTLQTLACSPAQGKVDSISNGQPAVLYSSSNATSIGPDMPETPGSHIRRKETPYPFARSLHGSPVKSTSPLPPLTRSTTTQVLTLPTDAYYSPINPRVPLPPASLPSSRDELSKRSHVPNDIEPALQKPKRQKRDKEIDAQGDRKVDPVGKETGEVRIDYQDDTVDKKEGLRKELLGFFRERRGGKS